LPGELFQLAEREGIVIEWWDFKPPLEAVYWAVSGMPPVIGLANSLESASKAYFRCVVAEELGHHFTTIGHCVPRIYYHYHDRTEISRAEYRALRWAAKWLMPLDGLATAFRHGIIGIEELAEYFEVTEDMVKFRLNLPDILEFQLAG